MTCLKLTEILQYQSCWKTFQTFLQKESIQVISQDVLLRFLCHLFHDKNRTLATIRTHGAAFKAPLFYGCNMTLDTHWLTWLHQSFFLQRPPCRQPRQFWSLAKVLDSLAPPQFPVSPSNEQLFRKALFLAALASGMRASQLHALSRHAAWTVFATNDALVSLSPVPLFLAKMRGRVTPYLLLPFLRGSRKEFIIHCVQLQRFILTYFLRKLHHGRISLCGLILSVSVQEFRLLKNCARLLSQRIQGNVLKARMCGKWLPPSCFYALIPSTLLVKVVNEALPVHPSGTTEPLRLMMFHVWLWGLCHNIACLALHRCMELELLYLRY
ncbi:hypothetical protein Pcinc_003505 [Petrolisthes cinctipes]|uniref:Uncharacterized protein n=1 Tax=Petrolisthes cinctipes TaxID=88211 RepID=A0AAE1GNN7_PETCI|nr:hypothetical protein Pcinc_003505 [Petrolisthes cinctipes]